ncbi:MAG: hypothetical protein HN379_11400 [Desulfobacteraceae bacterium]|nr:hypothetical protein [Desulfobacteraceae bacterium]MBT4363487.1 hypothetical protein [Desulfobacteraceae bacterium]
MQRYKKGILICLVCIMAFLPVSAMALRVNHAGNLSTSAVLKDVDGFQSGFLSDYNEFVSQYNYIKINLNIIPEYAIKPKLRFEKAFLSYRGGYDSIYDITDRYNAAPTNVDTANFQYGKTELRFENDLREITADFVYESGDTNWKLRVGRQITIWGEADLLALVDVVNPTNMTNSPGSPLPEDNRYPTWQLRLEVSTIDVGPFEQVGLQLLLIPEVVPDLWAAFGTPFGFPVPFPFVHQIGHSGTEDMEFGARLGFDVGPVHGDFYFFEGYQNGFGLDLGAFFATGAMVMHHPKSTLVGTSGQYWSDWARGIFRWEASYQDVVTYADAAAPMGFLTYNTVKGMVSFDRPLHFPKIFRTRSAQNSSYHFYATHIPGYPGQTATAPKEKNSYMIGYMLSTDYNNGRVKPSLVLMYEPFGVTFVIASVEVMRQAWKFKLGQKSVWGNSSARAATFAALIPGSTITATIEYNF